MFNYDGSGGGNGCIVLLALAVLVVALISYSIWAAQNLPF